MKEGYVFDPDPLHAINMNRDGFAGGQIIYIASRLSDSLVS